MEHQKGGKSREEKRKWDARLNVSQRQRLTSTANTKGVLNLLYALDEHFMPTEVTQSALLNLLIPFRSVILVTATVSQLGRKRTDLKLLQHLLWILLPFSGFSKQAYEAITTICNLGLDGRKYCCSCLSWQDRGMCSCSVVFIDSVGNIVFISW